MLKEVDCILFHCARYNIITPTVTMGLWGLADHLTSHGFNTKIVHTGIKEEYHKRFNVVDYIHEHLLVAGCYLLSIKQQNGIETFEVNDSLYELLRRCEDNTTKKGDEIVKEVVSLYTDDEHVGDRIESEMLVAIEQLAQAGVLKVVESGK